MVLGAHNCSLAFAIVFFLASHRFLSSDNSSLKQDVTEDLKAAAKEHNRLSDEAKRHFAAGKIAETITAGEAMLAIERKFLPSGNDIIVQSLQNLGEMYIEQDDLAAAKASWLEAFEALRKRNGETHWKSIDARLALDDVERRTEMTRQQRKKLSEAARLNRTALSLSETGSADEAVKLATRALALRRDVLGTRHIDCATSLNNLASAHDLKGEYAIARPLYEQALAIRKESLGERHPKYARSLNNLGYLLYLQGDYTAARPLYEKALLIRREVLGERDPDYAESLNNLAALFDSQADYAAARPLYEQALAIHKEVLGEHHHLFAVSLNNLAVLLKSQGDYAAARPLYEQAMAIRKEVLGEHHPKYGNSLNNLADLLHLEGDYAAAKPLYESALAIARQAIGERSPEYAQTLNSLALLLGSQGDYAAARSFLEKALAIRESVLGEHHPVYAASLSDLGFLHWRKRDHAIAAPLLKQALELEQSGLDLAAAAQSERQQLAMAHDIRWRLDAYLSLAPLAKLAPWEAYRHVLASKGAILEHQRRLRVLRRRFQTDPRSQAAKSFNDYQQAVKRLAALALATPDPKRAQPWRVELIELSRRKDELEAELARLDAGFRAERDQASRTPAQLQAAIPRGTAIVDMLVYTAYRQSDGENGHFQTERHVVAFVIRPDRPIARIEFGPIAPISKAIDEWRHIRVGQQATRRVAGDPARALRELIWEPLEAEVEGVTTVLVSPDEALGQVPLGALPGKKPNSYLIEERSIFVVPVPRMIGTIGTAPSSSPGPRRGRPEEASSLLLAGDVEYGGESGTGADRGASRSAAVPTRAGLLGRFDPLPATADEIASIGRDFRNRFRGDEVMKLTGKEATEEAFRRAAPKSRYLHLATHGYFAPPELRSALGPQVQKGPRPGIDILGGAGVVGYHPGLLSGIVLAGANRRPTPIGQDDGILTALEVAELDLSSVDLVVLSACETGLGEVAGGEGLLGLQRAFQVADAKTVIASLWSVDDEATGLLIAEFYRNLWERQLPKGEALRQAQLKMLRGELRPAGSQPKDARGLRRPDAPKDYRTPYYWAAFVLSGDWR